MTKCQSFGTGILFVQHPFVILSQCSTNCHYDSERSEGALNRKFNKIFKNYDKTISRQGRSRA